MTEAGDHPDQDKNEEELRLVKQTADDVRNAYALTDDQLRRLNEQLDAAKEASGRMGRHDWLLLFAGALASTISVGLIPPHISSLAIAIIASVLALAGVILIAIVVRRARRSPELPDPDAPLRQRIEKISRALTSSARSLGLAASLIADLQTELSSRAEALEALRQEISDNEELAKVTAQESQAIDRLVDARLKEQERRMRRVGWRQGLVYAIFGAVIAVAVGVFSHSLQILI